MCASFKTAVGPTGTSPVKTSAAVVTLNADTCTSVWMAIIFWHAASVRGIMAARCCTIHVARFKDDAERAASDDFKASHLDRW